MKKIIFAFLISVMGAQAAEPEGEKKWSKRASHRAGLILENVDQVLIAIYPGMVLRDMDLDRIGLTTEKNPMRSLQGDSPHGLLLDEKEMETFVAALADGGVLDGVSHYDPSLKIVRELFHPRGYAISIVAASWVMEMDLGMDHNTVKTLETLRKGLDGEAGKAMDQLLEKLKDAIKDREAETETKLKP